MLDALISRARTLLSRRFDDSPLPGDLTLLELDAEIDDLESQRRTARELVQRARTRYRELAARAAVADEPALTDVRERLASVIERYDAQVRRFARTHSVLSVLRQYALAASVEDDVDDVWADVDFDPDVSHPWLDDRGDPPRTRDELDERISKAISHEPPPRPADVLEFDPSPDAEALVDVVVDAARSTHEVPTLHALLGDRYARETGTESETATETIDLDVADDASSPDAAIDEE